MHSAGPGIWRASHERQFSPGRGGSRAPPTKNLAASVPLLYCKRCLPEGLSAGRYPDPCHKPRIWQFLPGSPTGADLWGLWPLVHQAPLGQSPSQIGRGQINLCLFTRGKNPYLKSIFFKSKSTGGGKTPPLKISKSAQGVLDCILSGLPGSSTGGARPEHTRTRVAFGSTGATRTVSIPIFFDFMGGPGPPRC